MVLPTFKATQIFDRNNLVEEIDRLLHRPDADPHQPQSIALHGLGGVGKSYVALKYAQSKRPELDAILWIYSETPTAIAASFTDIALRLELSGANPEHSEKNRVLVLSWLQSTTAKWLLVFDNAESPDVLLRYWPPACSGLILITTRNHNLAFEPAGGGLEVPHFDSQSGSDLILHLLRLNISQDLAEAESSSAVQLSERLSGHALALSTMAGLIHRRQWTIQEFLKVYDRDKERIHLRSLDAIWHLSFESLSPEAFRLLGILSFLMPDSIQYDLLYREDMVDLPSLISFCTDDDECVIPIPHPLSSFPPPPVSKYVLITVIRLWTAISRLLELALIKRERGTGSLSIHRLVQTQFLFFMDVSQRQAAFSHAATLLNIAFPNKSRSSHQMYDTWSVCRKYLQHVLSLIRAYSNEQGLASPLRPTREFCELLVRCGRYLGEIGMYSEMQDLLDVALGAYHAWEQRDEFPLVLADLERHLSVLWLQRGDFRKSEDHMIRALEIVEKDAATNIAVVLAPYNHMSNVVASAGRYDEAIMWQEKVLALSDKIEDDSMKRVALLNCNLGRALFLAGRVEEGKSRLELARDQFTGSQNWAMLAFTLFSLGNLYYFCESDVDRAEKLYTEAYDVWLKEGQAPTNEFVVSCLYRLGCCSLEHEDFTEAM
ncbi:TPR-like protein [Whalleya microplaca]|nr:TPR-like protein [Whalleya microplaca]